MLNMLDLNRKTRAAFRARRWAALYGFLLTTATLTGCQTTVGGQTLPSAYYLDDDVQFFPAGPEFLLPNQQAAIDEYRLEKQTLQDGNANAAP